MAAFTAAALLQGAVASVAFQRVQKPSFARFDGLKACLVMRPRVASVAAVPAQRLVISASADHATLDVVQTIIADQLAVDKSTVLPGSKFADLGADSLDTVEIMMALEEQFKIQLDEDGAEAITTVQEAADLIHQVIVSKA